MKRIEEFTVDDLLNVWFKDDGQTARDGMKAIIDYIKANLDTGKREPMSVEEIEEWLKDGHGEAIEMAPTFRRIADIIQPLTVQQGFVPDWRVLETANHAEIGIKYVNVGGGVDVWECKEIIQRPATKIRQKPVQQIAKEYVDKMSGAGNRADAYLVLVEKMANGEKLEDLCRAAGIPLETQE